MSFFNAKKTELLKIANTKMKLDELKSPNIIFVYCPPKVGSTTIVSSIRICSTFKYTVLHIHDETMLNVLTGVSNVTIKEIILYNSLLGRNVIVIDIYRSPIERKMSEFFDKISSFHFNNHENKIVNYNIQRLTSRFNNIFSHLSKSDYYREEYGINVPAEFDFINKYLLVEQNGIKYIKLRLCDSNNWSSILSKLLETDIIIFTDYETKNQPLGKLYEAFKREYKIPENYLNDIIDSDVHFDYYYSDEEKINYIEYWNNKKDYTWIGYSEREYAIYNNICIENQWIKDVQAEHYLDLGCRCKACTRKRKQIFLNAKSGKMPREKIIHDEAVKEYTLYKQNIIAERFESNLTNQTFNGKNKFKNNLMTNVYETRINPW